MKPLERLGDREREVITERRATGYRVDSLEHFSGELEPVLRGLVEALLPGVPEQIDVAAFVDQRTGDPLGRGDRPPGVPPEKELFTQGLRALQSAGFSSLGSDEQRALITRMRHGDADKELGMPAKVFVDRLLDKALSGYLAHPDTWERIGFGGPAYPEGYAWIDPPAVKARHERKAGWQAL